MPGSSHDRVKLGNTSQSEVGEFQIKQAVIDEDTAGDQEIVAAVETKKIRVIGIHFAPLVSDLALTWKSASTALLPAATWLAGSGHSDYWGPNGFFFETVAGEALNLNLGGSVQIGGCINYIEV